MALGLLVGPVAAPLPLAAAQGIPESASIVLPNTCELDKLTELVAQTTRVSLQYGAGRLTGAVRLSVSDPVTTQDLWGIYHQALGNQGFTTVVAGQPVVYQVVPLADAAQYARVLTTEERAALPYPPGYQVVVRVLQHLTADQAIKALGAISAGPAIQLRSLGSDPTRLVIAAPANRQSEFDGILKLIDRPGLVPVIRLFRCERTAPQSLQTTATAAWSALGRVGERARVAEVQIAPDNLQLVLVASAEDIDALVKLVLQLDQSEPVETRTYRPAFFSLEEVAGLIQQTLGAQSPVQIVRDRLTGSLVVKATAAEHQRIATVMKTLDEAPPGARRQARAITIKHRKASEVAQLVMALVSSDGGSVSGGTSAGGNTTARAATPPVAASGTGTGQRSDGNPGTSSGTSGGSTGSSGGSGVNAPARQRRSSGGEGAGATVATSADGSLVITADQVTNRLLVLGEPRVIEQIERILTEIDQRQPQVDIELTMVSLSDDQSRTLGVELARQFESHGSTVNLASLFGMSTGTGPGVDRALKDVNGFAGVVLKPDQYAAVVRALETVNQGRSVITSRLVVGNNGQASLNGVTQQPISAVNSGSQVATTSYAGTSDAGTQVTFEPHISAADYVTLDYTIGQSTFLGSPTTTSSGTIPAPKSNNNLSSTATIPDGHVIAVGGLTTTTASTTESRLPWLGAIPYVGALFKTSTTANNNSRLFAFIRVTILRHSQFSDLRYVSSVRAEEAKFDGGTPRLEPLLLK